MKINNKFFRIAILTAAPVVWWACSESDSESDAYGNFEAKETIISAEVSGKVLNFSVEEGSVLKKGETVGLIDTIQLSLKKEQLIAQKKAVSSRTDNIFAQIRVLDEQNDKLVFEKQRIEKLLKDGAATQKQLDDIESQIKVNQKQIASIQAQNSPVINEQKVYDVQIKQIEDQIARSIIVNPVNGSVLEKYCEPFEMTSAGKALYKIADLTKVELRVYVSGDQLSEIKPGKEVDVLYDSGKGELTTVKGTVSWISSQAEFTPKIIQTREERVNLVYAVKIIVENDGSIKFGMPGEIKF
ncbi:MAG: hypothetical protein A2W91_12105 [Bacteroidetes bacterium GWF2_38_335]|nr:MAG: hypothetical protein A2W91_12105 [Bacteroidetes bacterium GWF2_38_335]OFY76916.1 MAG: hypothetical protein A2281_00220 [Bacteroidetes bacterium RIFOXYA12_FULL_38_20]HBS86765.1 HlyD family secretion protein [Bacteroidales bacterium]